jgi:hypothetical protein
MEVRTPYGEGTTPEHLDEVLDRFQETADEEMFVVVDRGDAFLQMRQLPIEMGKDGKVWRARVPEALRATFRDFAAGRPDWDRGLEWIDLAALRKPPPTRGSRVLTLVGLALACLAVGFALARILPRVL